MSIQIRVSLLLILSILSFPGVTGETLRLGIVNERPDRADHALKQFLPLNNYLKKELKKHNIKVAPLTVAKSIDELASRIEKGQVDAFIEGVMPTLIIRNRTKKVFPELLVWRKGQRQYHSVFFVRKDSQIQNLREIGGKTIVFEAPRSTSAYFLPSLTLESEGFNLIESGRPLKNDRSVPYLFAGSETNQAYWVHNGKGDIGAFNNGDWERVPNVIKQDLKIIGRTKPVLRWLFSYTTNYQTETKQKINNVLINAYFSEEGRQALKTASNIKKIETLTLEDRNGLHYWDRLLHK